MLLKRTRNCEPSTSPGSGIHSNVASTSESSAIEGDIDMYQSGTADHVPHKSGGSKQVWSKPRTLLCRDGIPDILQELYKTADVATLHDAVFVVIHVLMLETGYLPLVSQ